MYEDRVVDRRYPTATPLCAVSANRNPSPIFMKHEAPLADMSRSQDPEETTARGHVFDVYRQILAKNNTVELNGRDPEVLARLKAMKKRLFDAMLGAKKHGWKAVSPELIAEARQEAETPHVAH